MILQPEISPVPKGVQQTLPNSPINQTKQPQTSMSPNALNQSLLKPSWKSAEVRILAIINSLFPKTPRA